MDKTTTKPTPPTTGWLILNSQTLQPIELLLDEDPTDEAPYSNDNDILQFHLSIDFNTEYPTASIIIQE
jgi:hypothetical protein